MASANKTSAALLEPLPSELALLTSRATAANVLASESVQSIIDRLEAARARIVAGGQPDSLVQLSDHVKKTGTRVAAAQKDWSSAISKFGKSVDKKFNNNLEPLFPPSEGSTSATPFGSPAAVTALNSTIALHLARLGDFDTLRILLEESETTTSPPSHLLNALRELHEILLELRRGQCTRALEWASANPSYDPDRDLEFELRTEEFTRLLLLQEEVASNDQVDKMDLYDSAPQPLSHAKAVQAALAYGGLHFRPLMSERRASIICALLTSVIYMPRASLSKSPYAWLYADHAGNKTGETRLQQKFGAAYLRKLGLPKESPLTVVTDVGGGGAVARIHKMRAVMKEKKTEWTSVGELPVEIPLATKHKYHSIFACPVSKEQSTEANPPMLLPCGHVIARDSLHKLSRGAQTVKCPYCPVVSQLGQAVRVYF